MDWVLEVKVEGHWFHMFSFSEIAPASDFNETKPIFDGPLSDVSFLSIFDFCQK